MHHIIISAAAALCLWGNSVLAENTDDSPTNESMKTTLDEEAAQPDGFHRL